MFSQRNFESPWKIAAIIWLLPKCTQLRKCAEKVKVIKSNIVCDVFTIWPFPANSYIFKVSKSNSRLRCENCSRLKIKTLERRRWRRLGDFIVNWEHISLFDLIVDFEQTNVCWVNIEMTNPFEDKIGYIISCVIVF